jgi:hypothetical protein
VLEASSFGALLSSLTYTRPKDDVERFAYALFGVNRTTITIAGGLSGALVGVVVGGVVGAIAKKSFIIGGGKEKFDAMKSKLIN